MASNTEGDYPKTNYVNDVLDSCKNAYENDDNELYKKLAGAIAQHKDANLGSLNSRNYSPNKSTLPNHIAHFPAYICFFITPNHLQTMRFR